MHSSAPTVEKWDVARVTVDMLPDVALLEIFDFFLGEGRNEKGNKIQAWYKLVHVCQKWRDVVFGSPLRLDLQLYCTAGSPVMKKLGVWPPLPIVICASNYLTWGVDNIIAALEHNNRISQLYLLDIPSLLLDKVFPAMQAPFPALTRLMLESSDEKAPIVPNSFLGRSAPRLQRLILDRIPFPGLPKLILSSTHLVCLRLWRIPHSGYISPESMATCLAVLTRLETLEIKFESPRSRPDRKSRHPPPQTLTLLPVLVDLSFHGVCEYLEDLVARIDTPLLNKLIIFFFPSTDIRRSTTHPIHQSHTKVQGTKSNIRVFFRLGCCGRSTNVWKARVGELMQSVRLAAFVSGTVLQLVPFSASHSCDGIPRHRGG